ncbi:MULTISPECIES: type IV pilus modification protein PilV [Ramlibacter]|uniref:Type IV pilus modification protein PilV n=1 Tax=Ramlibacter aquaticus TaxID=2780094 RepID=A0ABR9SJM4_9BURK|nr:MULTISPECIES: type IV pilus modification protein PilV [Ramlibacter]MBE7941972.1 type IV pilus modification protein PilV [Ramlibacter aquaticus]
MARTPRVQAGASLIEVLVTMVIIAFGLLGMAGLQSRMQVAEVEAYQRAQALVLLDDMAHRISTNRNAAISGAYVASIDPTTSCSSAFGGSTAAQKDLKDWCSAIQGAGEMQGTNKAGAVIAGRGCVESLGNRDYMITVAWQGLTPISAPPTSVGCGANAYDGGTGSSNTQCVNDLCRRVVTTIVRIASLV